MIKDSDVDFHPFDAKVFDWAETNFFGFTIPEENIFGQIHLLARPAAGAALIDFFVTRGTSENLGDCLIYDSRKHVPIGGNRLSDFRTPYGLHIKALNIRQYEISYEGANGTSLNLVVNGVMEPFDLQDPAMNPRAPKPIPGKMEGEAFGAAYTNHFDMTAHVTGTLVVGGKRYEIDCIETMDHSWGPRPEVDTPPGGWMHAHFNDRFAAHWITKWTDDGPNGERQALAHGYLLQDGAIHGLTDLTIEAVRSGAFIETMVVIGVDARGKNFELRGELMAGAPWPIYGDAASQMMRWTADTGEIGYGIAQDGCSFQHRMAQKARLGSS